METIPKLNDDEFLCTLTHRCLALVLLYQSIVLKRMKTPEFGTLKSYSELLVHSNSNSRILRKPSMWFWYKHEREKFTSQRRFTMPITSICSKGLLSSFVSFISHMMCTSVWLLCVREPLYRQSFVMISAREFCAVLVVLLSLPRSLIVEWGHSELKEEAMLQKRKMAGINNMRE